MQAQLSRFRKFGNTPCALRHTSQLKKPLISSSPSLATWRRVTPSVALRAASLTPTSPSKGDEVQSTKIDRNVLEKTERAIERLQYRVTVGDVASTAGITLEEADDALKALAYDSLGSLEVSAEGDVVYAFDRNFRSAINQKSFWLRTRPFFDKVGQAAKYVTRVAFGSSLIASVAVVWLAITLLLSAKSNDDRNSGRNNQQYRQRGYGGNYGGNYGGSSAYMFMDVGDLFYYWSPRYYRNTQAKLRRGEQLTFVESIFSFVFGDGDPNEDFNERRWAQLGQMIAAKGGVVTAEEMAPYLDIPQPSSGEEKPFGVDEGYVIPALIKFGGEAVVDESGNLLYEFPRLQRSAEARNTSPTGTFDVATERPWKFTAATSGQTLGIWALGLINIIGVVALTVMLSDPQMKITAAYNGLGWIGNILPWLQGYATAFFAIPAVRWVVNESRNRAIAVRNELRLRAVELLNSGNRKLQDKVSRARAKGRKKVLNKRDAIYDTAKEAQLSLEPGNDERDWEKRFEGSSKQREKQEAERRLNNLRQRQTNGLW